MNINKFKHKDWVQIWEGGWSFLSCSHFGDQYTKEVRFGSRPFVSQAIIFSKNGRSSAWIRQTDRNILGKYLSQQVVKNPQKSRMISQDLKKQVDYILPFIKNSLKSKINSDTYKDFWHRISVYYKPHINVKYIVDYLDKKLLSRLLPLFENARIYAEPVFGYSEEFMVNFAKHLGKQLKCDYKLILCLTKKELNDFFKNHKIPSKRELKNRYQNSILIFDEKDSRVLVGAELKEVEDIIFGSKDIVKLKGLTAYPGKIVAIARVINDPKLGAKLKKGEILISGMTRPEFLPIMERASAFVTDAGGILAHAAIVAREMKKPCITGTKIATKIFKDGDLVEVDANKGTVRKI
jgi:phosphohistidine swiveling domain-containing protein